MRTCWPILMLIFFLANNCQKIFALPSDSLKTKRWYVPDFIPLQFAGNIGFLSTGIGYSARKENFQIALMYGYTPAIISKVPIHTVTVKNYFTITRLNISGSQTLIPYLGLGITLETGGNAFLKLPSYYPKEYYAPKALHFIGYGGFKLPHEFNENDRVFRGLELYVEAGAVEQYLWYKARSRQIKFSDIFSLALGVSLLLR